MRLRPLLARLAIVSIVVALLLPFLAAPAFAAVGRAGVVHVDVGFALIAGAVIPVFVAVLAKSSASPFLKRAVTAVLAIAAAVVDLFVMSNGTVSTLTLVETIAATFLAATGLYHVVWKPTGAAPAMARATERVGIG